MFLLSFVFIHVMDVQVYTHKPFQTNADDPSPFLTRVEIFNEFQHYYHLVNARFLRVCVFLSEDTI